MRATALPSDAPLLKVCAKEKIKFTGPRGLRQGWLYYLELALDRGAQRSILPHPGWPYVGTFLCVAWASIILECTAGLLCTIRSAAIRKAQAMKAEAMPYPCTSMSSSSPKL